MNQKLQVHVVTQLKDNYSYVVADEASKCCLIVDPAEAESIIDVITKQKLKLTHILLTHHHDDHIAGCSELKEFSNCEIIGPEKEADKIAGIDQTVADMDIIYFQKHPIKVIETPGHTSGHIAFWFYEDHLLFCGDTLFGAGCGKVFEGSYHDMWQSLCKLRALPKETMVYCGHEYTEDNLKFAQSIETDNPTLNEYAKRVKTLRENDQPTVPFNLEQEVLVNPFLRADLPKWPKLLALKEADPTAVFKHLRELKNKFKA